MKDTPIQELLEQVDEFSVEQVDKLFAMLLGRISQDDRSLAGYVVRGKIKEANQEECFQSRREIAAEILSLIRQGEIRASYDGQEVDYRKSPWVKGNVCLFGQLISECPVCGELGSIAPPYKEHFKGSTEHVVRPFFMGVTPLLRCDWETGTTEKLNDWASLSVLSVAVMPDLERSDA